MDTRLSRECSLARIHWLIVPRESIPMKEEKILYLGIDVASRTNVGAFLDQSDRVIRAPLEFPNSQMGAETLEKTLVEICQKSNFSQIKIGTEATSFYDWHLADYLASSVRLLPFCPEIYRFNPKIIHHFKKVLKDLEKTDFVDAEIIAKRLKFGNLPAPYSSLQEYQPLQRLTRYRFHLIHEIVREKGFLLSHLFLKHSAICLKRPIKRVLGATSRTLINEYLSADEICQASLEELSQLIVKASRNRIQEPEKLAQLIKQVSRESYRIRPNLAKSLNLILSLSFRSIRSYQESLKEINRAVGDEIKGFQETLTSVPGIGPVYAAGILSEIGKVSRFKSADALAKYAGLWWPRKQSGEFEAQDRPMRKTGNVYLRYYLIEAANSMRVHNEEYRAFYQKKFKEVRQHQHKRALVLTARKLVRLVFSLLKTSTLYQKEK